MRYLFSVVWSTAIVAVVTTMSGASAADAIDSKILQAESPTQLVGELKRLFSKADGLRLMELARSDDLTIALHAYWRLNNVRVELVSGEPRGDERVEFSSSNNESMPGPNKQGLDPAHASRILGFFDAKLRVNLPWFWEQAIRDPYLPGVVGHHATDDLTLANPNIWLRERLQLPYGWTLSQNGDDAQFYSSNELKFTLPKPIVDKIVAGAEHAEKLQLWTTKDRIAIAAFGGLKDVGYQLTMIDLDKRTIDWQATVWGMLPSASGIIGGSYSHHQEIVADSKKLVVFGQILEGVYLEAFDLEKGTPLFRFSTNYWYVWR